MGHGHVNPNPDGSKARCGGPKLCSVCAREQRSPVTTCHLCGTTSNESLVAHLEAHHLNEMLSMEVDPKSGVSVIHGRA